MHKNVLCLQKKKISLHNLFAFALLIIASPASDLVMNDDILLADLYHLGPPYDFVPD